MDGEDTGTGGRQNTGMGVVIQGSGTGGSFIWVRDVVADPPHGTSPGKIPAQGCWADYGEATKAMEG